MTSHWNAGRMIALSAVMILNGAALLAGQSGQAAAGLKIDASGYLEVGPDKIFYEVAGNGPVLVFILDGEFDIPDCHAHAGALNAGIFGSRRDIVRNAAHLVPLEQPEAFNKLVADFLSGTK